MTKWILTTFILVHFFRQSYHAWPLCYAALLWLQLWTVPVSLVEHGRPPQGQTSEDISRELVSEESQGWIPLAWLWRQHTRAGLDVPAAERPSRCHAIHRWIPALQRLPERPGPAGCGSQRAVLTRSGVLAEGGGWSEEVFHLTGERWPTKWSGPAAGTAAPKSEADVSWQK